MLVTLYYLINKYKYYLLGSFACSLTAALFDFLLISNMIVENISLNETLELILFLTISILFKVAASIINLSLSRATASRETEIILHSLSRSEQKIDSQIRASSETMIAYKLNDVFGSLIAILEGFKGFLIFSCLAIIVLIKMANQPSSVLIIITSTCVLIAIVIVTTIMRCLIEWGSQSNRWLNELSDSLKFVYTNQIEILLHKGDYIIQSVLFAQRKLRTYQLYVQVVSQNFRSFFELFGLLVFTISIFFGYTTHMALIVGLAALQRLMPNIQAIFHSLFALGVAKSALVEFKALREYKAPNIHAATVQLRGVNAFSYTADDRVTEINLGVTQKFVRGQIQRVSGPSGSGKSTYMWNLTGALGSHGTIQINKEFIKDYLFDSVEYFDNESRIYGNNYRDYFQTNDVRKVRNLLSDLLLPAEIIDKLVGEKKRFSSACENLSEGEYQRVKLAKSLISNKDLILLDEPFSALDQETSIQAARQVQNYTKNCFCLLVDHGARDEDI